MQQVTEGKDWVRGLDSLRFVLALIVFLSHLDNHIAIFLKSFGNAFLNFLGIAVNHLYLGPGAVVAFFIISGFVIHYPFKDKALNVKQFLVRRWVRISLPLLVALAIALYMGGIRFIPIWSLYCELIYYTLYPLLRKLPVSWSIQFWIAFVISLALMFTMGANTELQSMLEQRNIDYTGSYAALGDGYTWLIGLPCWLIGVIIAENIDNIKTHVSKLKIYLIRFAVLATSMVIVGLKAHWFVSYLFTLNLFSLALGYWIANEILFFRDHAPMKALEYAGKFSYSLYLLHVILVAVLVSLFGSSLATYPLIIILTILLSYLFFALVEDPSHRVSKYLARKVQGEKRSNFAG
jgi:peptidoglycan/LPS O-acetylase OafA/YrhL